jgi:hypothetical protein
MGRFASTSGLVIGSIAPDMAYFLPSRLDPFGSHTIAGLFVFCVPVGLAIYYAFHSVVAPLLFDLVPELLRGRLPAAWTGTRLPERPPEAVVSSILLGAATHLIWDSFTHANGWAVLAFPLLTTPLFSWQGYTVFVYKVLQHGSTLFGLSVILWWAIHWLRTSQPRAHQAPPAIAIRFVLLTMLLVPPAIAGIVSASSAHAANAGGLAKLQAWLGAAVLSSGSVFLISLLVVAVSSHFTRRPTSR